MDGRSIFESLNVRSIENILIFVSDSLRWDYTPKEVMERGVTFKTIASSLYTASSFPSIVTGLNPPKHGIYTWKDQLPGHVGNLLKMEGYTTSLWAETMWTDLPPDSSEIHSILNIPPGIPLEKIEPPFIFIEDDKGGHCPYGFPFGVYSGGPSPEFFDEYGKRGREELLSQYQIGVQQSRERFEGRIHTLEQRGLLDSTLIIFTSDHGELLGEYGGLTGHGRPPCPEMVYVPSVFIHPSLKPSMVTDRVFRHVDFFPTILGILGVDPPYASDGINMLESAELPQFGLNFRKKGYAQSPGGLKRKLTYGATSIWDYGGGHVFHDLGNIRAKILFFYRIFLQKHSEFNFMIQSLQADRFQERLSKRLLGLKHLSDHYIQYAEPNMTRKTAEKMIAEYYRNVGEIHALERSLDKETRKRLEALGYID